MLKNEVASKMKLIKQQKIDQEQMHIEYGRKIAELFEDIEVAEAKLKKANAESALLQEELGDLQFLQMEDKFKDDYSDNLADYDQVKGSLGPRYNSSSVDRENNKNMKYQQVGLKRTIDPQIEKIKTSENLRAQNQSMLLPTI